MTSLYHWVAFSTNRDIQSWYVFNNIGIFCCFTFVGVVASVKSPVVSFVGVWIISVIAIKNYPAHTNTANQTYSSLRLIWGTSSTLSGARITHNFDRMKTVYLIWALHKTHASGWQSHCQSIFPIVSFYFSLVLLGTSCLKPRDNQRNYTRCTLDTTKHNRNFIFPYYTLYSIHTHSSLLQRCTCITFELRPA